MWQCPSLGSDWSPNSWELTCIGRSMASQYHLVYITWKCWREALKTLELKKTPFTQQPGTSESCCKDPLGLFINLLLCTVLDPPNRGREAVVGGCAVLYGGVSAEAGGEEGEQLTSKWLLWGGGQGTRHWCQIRGSSRIQGHFLVYFFESRAAVGWYKHFVFLLWYIRTQGGVVLPSIK